MDGLVLLWLPSPWDVKLCAEAYMSLKDQIDGNKEQQGVLRDFQLKRDNQNTFGHKSKDPCRKEKDASLLCIELRRENDSINCNPYFENYKSCKQFWNAVQNYRIKYMKKNKNNFPEGEEYDKWKNQLPEWIATKKLKNPDPTEE